MAATRKSARRKTARRVSKSTTSSDKTIFLLAAALVVAIGGYLFLSGQDGAPAAPARKVASVVLSAQSNSNESGSATLKEVDGKVVVSLDLVGAPKGVSQPAHIHTGACPNPGAVSYPLTSPVDGKSETILDVSMGELMAKLPLAVNVHKSVAQSKVYVSCGNVTAPVY